ncbi:MAG: hypothetical protein ACJA13_002398 [Paraglaciecola sp.]|jgi:hypothetical protein
MNKHLQAKIGLCDLFSKKPVITLILIAIFNFHNSNLAMKTVNTKNINIAFANYGFYLLAKIYFL